MFRKTTLQNGLRVVTEKLESTKAVTVLVLAGVGSRYEKKEINGISHFLEHMFFKGGKKYPNARVVAEAIDSVGGDFNAFTGKEYAGYYVKVSAQHQNIAMSVLGDMLVNARFDDEDIDRERGVIIEEYNMYQDTPMYQAGWDFERLLFGDQPLGWDEVGSKEFILRVKHEDFAKYKKDLYTSDNVVIAVTGNVDHNDVIPKIEKAFQFENQRRAYDWAHFKGISDKRVYLTNKKTEQVHLVLGFPGYEDEHEDHYVEKILSVILGGNMSSRMFLSLREQKGLAYYIQTTTDDYQDIGVISTRSGVDLKRVDDAIKAIIEEYVKVLKSGIPQDEVKKAKDYLKGKIVLRLEDSEEFAHLLGKQELLHEKIKTPEEILKAIDKVTADDIKRVSEDLFKEDELRIALIGPFEEEGRFERLLKF